MLVCGQHFSEEVIREISATVESEPTISRRSLSRKVCEWLKLERREVEDWAEDEFGQADLGDRRLTKRLVSIVREFYARPQVSVPQACQSRAKTKAAYRFFEHPHMSMDKVVEQHYESTLGRVSQEGVVEGEVQPELPVFRCVLQKLP